MATNPTVLGNNARRRVHWGHKPLGAGAPNQLDSTGHLELHGKAGDIVVLRDSDVLTHPDVNFPPVFQAVGAGVEVSFTLVNIARAQNLDPLIQADIPWANTTTVTAGNIVESPIPNFTAIRIEFQGTGEFYILGR